MGSFAKQLIELQNVYKEKSLDKESITKKVKERLEQWKVEGKIPKKEIEDCVVDIVTIKKDLNEIIFSHSFNGPEADSLDTAIFNSLLKFNKKLNINQKIEKTIEWNRYDIAKKELFNEKSEWVCFE